MKNSYKKATLIFIFLLICRFTFAQFLQTDQFDYWEDKSTHAYTVSGITMKGAYSCPSDSSLRLGSCGQGVGSVSIDLTVTPNTDSIRLSFLIAIASATVTGGYSPAVMSIDGVNQGDVGLWTQCVYKDIIIKNALSYTADGTITLTIADTIFGCVGDIQLSRVKVYSPAVTGVSFNQNELDPKLILSPNPSKGQFTLVSPITKGEIFIYNISGEKILSQNMQHQKSEIDISKQPNGIYFLQVIANEEVVNKKIIINK